MLKSGTRFDNDSYYEMMIDEEQNTARIIGENNGVPVDWEVGGLSDFSTAEVTVTNNADSVIKPRDFPTLTEADTISCGAELYPSVSKDFEVVMYKGTARCYVCDNSDNTIPSSYVTVTGAIEKITDIEGEDWYCLITGDGTISVP